MHSDQLLHSLTSTYLTDVLESYPFSCLHQPDLSYHDEEDYDYDNNSLSDNFDHNNNNEDFADTDHSYLDWFALASPDQLHHYQSHITADTIQVAIPSLLNTATLASIFCAPRTEKPIICPHTTFGLHYVEGYAYQSCGNGANENVVA
eukprot:4671429-Ditylum_brightwellii.AAC.1